MAERPWVITLSHYYVTKPNKRESISLSFFIGVKYFFAIRCYRYKQEDACRVAVIKINYSARE